MNQPMNRSQRRKYVKEMNTPKKLEQYSSELDRRLRDQYEEKSNEKIKNFIKSYTLLMAFVLDSELETEKNIKMVAPKGKNESKQIATIVKDFMKDVNKHLILMEEGYIKIDEIDNFFQVERNLNFNFEKKGEIFDE